MKTKKLLSVWITKISDIYFYSNSWPLYFALLDHLVSKSEESIIKSARTVFDYLALTW